MQEKRREETKVLTACRKLPVESMAVQRSLPPSPAPHKAPPKPCNGNGEYQLAPNPNPAAADTKIASTTITITIFRTLPRSRSRSRKCTLNSANTHVCKPFPSLWKPKPKTQSNCQQSHRTPAQLREIMTFTARRWRTQESYVENSEFADLGMPRILRLMQIPAVGPSAGWCKQTKPNKLEVSERDPQGRKIRWNPGEANPNNFQQSQLQLGRPRDRYKGQPSQIPS